MYTLNQLKQDYNEVVQLAELCKTNSLAYKATKEMICNDKEYFNRTSPRYLRIIRDEIVVNHISAINPGTMYTGLHDYVLIDDLLHSLLKTIGINIPVGDLIFITETYFASNGETSDFGIKEFTHSDNTGSHTFTAEEYLFLQDVDYSFFIPTKE